MFPFGDHPPLNRRRKRPPPIEEWLPPLHALGVVLDVPLNLINICRVPYAPSIPPRQKWLFLTLIGHHIGQVASGRPSTPIHTDRIIPGKYGQKVGYFWCLLATFPPPQRARSVPKAIYA